MRYVCVSSRSLFALHRAYLSGSFDMHTRHEGFAVPGSSVDSLMNFHVLRTEVLLRMRETERERKREREREKKGDRERERV